MPLTRLGEDLIDEILAEYPELKSLNLSENEIKIFEQLDRIVSLERVNLSHNRLIQIGGGVLPHLIDLNLSYNQLYVVPMLHIDPYSCYPGPLLVDFTISFLN